MKRFVAICSLLTAFAFAGGDLAFAGAEKNPLKPRVPRSDRGMAKKIKPPAELYKKTKKPPTRSLPKARRFLKVKGPASIVTGKRETAPVRPEKC